MRLVVLRLDRLHGAHTLQESGSDRQFAQLALILKPCPSMQTSGNDARA